QAFAAIFKKVRDNQSERPPSTTDKRINSRGLELTPSEGAQLAAILAPLNDEVQRASAVQESSRYFAFREAAAAGAVTLLPAPLEPTPTVGDEEPFGVQYSARAMQMRAIKDYSARAGGRNNFDYMIVSDFPEGGVSRTFQEFTERQGHAQS